MKPVVEGDVTLENARGAVLTLPNTVTVKVDPLNIITPMSSLQGRDGAVVSGSQKVSPRSFRITGLLLDPDHSGVWSRASELFAMLQYPPIRVNRFGSHRYPIRELWGYPQGLGRSWDRLETISSLRIDFKAPDPYYISQDETVWAQNLTTSQMTYAYNPVGEVDVQPVIEIDGPCNRPIIGNYRTGQEFTYQGELFAGETLVIDCRRFDARVTGGSDDGNKIQDLSQSFVLDGYTLQSNGNYITLVSTGGTSEVRMKYYARWLE